MMALYDISSIHSRKELKRGKGKAGSSTYLSQFDPPLEDVRVKYEILHREMGHPTSQQAALLFLDYGRL